MHIQGQNREQSDHWAKHENAKTRHMGDVRWRKVDQQRRKEEAKQHSYEVDDKNSKTDKVSLAIIGNKRDGYDACGMMRGDGMK